MSSSWGDWHGHSSSQRSQGSWWNKSECSWWNNSGWYQRESWRTDQWEGATGDVQWNQDKADDGASKEVLVDAELEACKDENERRQLLMRREVQKNLEKMALKEQRRQQEEAAKAAKAKKLQDEKDQKIREYRENQDKQFTAAMQAQDCKQLQEAERQRKLEEATARGRAAKRGAEAGRLKKEQKQAELERQAAEVLANIAISTTKKSGSADAVQTDREKKEELSFIAAEKVEAVEHPIRARPKRRPLIGPSMRAAAPEETPEEVLAHEPEPASASSGSSSKVAVTLKKKKKAMWWHKIDGECPISLSALCDFPQPPFALESCGGAEPHYFDARFLANYLVGACDFIDPNNRRPLTREECVALDEHLHWYYPTEKFIIVADAFDLFERNVAGEVGTSVQREAASVLSNLFRFSSSRRTDASGRAVNYQQGGLTVVDDDDVLAPDASVAARSSAPPRDDAEAFPSLPSDAPAPKAKAKAKAKSKAYPSASRGPLSDSEAYPTLLSTEPPLRGAWQKRQAPVALRRIPAARRPVTAEQRAAETADRIAAARADFERRRVDHWEDLA